MSLNDEHAGAEGKPSWIGRAYGSLGQALGLMERTTQGAFRATSPQAGVLQLALLASVIMLVLGVIVATVGGIQGKDNLIYAALIGAGMALLVIVIGMAFVRPAVLRPATPLVGEKNTKDDQGDVKWLRPAIRLPDDLGKLSEELRLIRKQGQSVYRELLAARNPTLAAVVDRVRVNVFVPDLEQTGKNAQVCELHIPDDAFSHGMPSDVERRIRFWPGQGVAGFAYVRNQHYGALRPSPTDAWRQVYIDGEPSIGEDVFQLTEKQGKVIDPALRWIISFPLCVTKDDKAFALGVLNLDGLEEALTEKEMGALYSALSGRVDRFADMLKPYIQCLIEIRILQNAA